MKFIYIFIIIFVFHQANAQQETLINSTITNNGGYGGPVIKITKLNDQSATLLGARGGWIINHSLSIGGGMYGLVGNISVDTKEGDIISSDSDYLRFGYGGLELEYIFNPLNVYHFSIYSLIGIGGISYREFNEGSTENGYFEHDHMKSTFFIFEPAVNFAVNITDFIHADLGTGYRFVSGENYQTTKAAHLAGFTGMFTLKFGLF